MRRLQLAVTCITAVVVIAFLAVAAVAGTWERHHEADTPARVCFAGNHGYETCSMARVFEDGSACITVSKHAPAMDGGDIHRRRCAPWGGGH